MSLFTTGARVLIGGLFVGHGSQKLFGSFGGHGLDATGQAFEGMGLTPGRQHALAAGVSEAGGGALFALGLATPFAGAAITGTMVQAVKTVHGDKGPWVTEGGWEYNAVLIAAVAAIVEQGGPGLGKEMSGKGWALFSLLAGVVGPEVFSRYIAPQLPAPPADPAGGPAPEAPHAAASTPGS